MGPRGYIRRICDTPPCIHSPCLASTVFFKILENISKKKPPKRFFLSRHVCEPGQKYQVGARRSYATAHADLELPEAYQADSISDAITTIHLPL